MLYGEDAGVDQRADVLAATLSIQNRVCNFRSLLYTVLVLSIVVSTSIVKRNSSIVCPARRSEPPSSG